MSGLLRTDSTATFPSSPGASEEGRRMGEEEGEGEDAFGENAFGETAGGGGGGVEERSVDAAVAAARERGFRARSMSEVSYANESLI